MKDHRLHHQSFIPRHHPAGLSLCIFPIIPQSKSNLPADSSYTSCKSLTEYVNEVKTFKLSLTVPSENEVLSKEKTTASKESIRKTKRKLDTAVAYLPSSEVLPEFSLPRISAPTGKRWTTHAPQGKQSRRNSRKQSQNEDIPKDQITPSISLIMPPCICDTTKPNNSNKAKTEYENNKINRQLKQLRPEECPPLSSLYVRWKNKRNGVSEYSHKMLVDLFQTFGNVSNVIYKSQISAIIVYDTIESASIAAKVMEKQGKHLKMHVKWLRTLSMKK